MRLINADNLYDKAEEKYKGSSGFYRPIYRGFVDDVANAPTIEAAPVVHGRWDVEEAGAYRNVKCSVCGKEYACHYGLLQLQNFGYCPNCGAKMDGGG